MGAFFVLWLDRRVLLRNVVDAIICGPTGIRRMRRCQRNPRLRDARDRQLVGYPVANVVIPSMLVFMRDSV